MRFKLVLVSVAMTVVMVRVAAAKDYSMEEHFKVAAQLPPTLISQVALEIGNEFPNYGCIEPSVEALLEGEVVQVGPKGKQGWLVRPKSACGCAVHSCPFWLFSADKPDQFRRIAKMDAGVFTIDESKTANGMFQLRASSGTSGWEDRSTWTFNGEKYRQVRRDHRNLIQ